MMKVSVTHFGGASLLAVHCHHHVALLVVQLVPLDDPGLATHLENEFGGVAIIAYAEL